jgi:hypothetical protein
MLNLSLSLEDTSRILRRFCTLSELEARMAMRRRNARVVRTTACGWLLATHCCCMLVARVDALMSVLENINRAIVATSGVQSTITVQKERLVCCWVS